MTEATFPVRIRRRFPEPVGLVQFEMQIPESNRWRFINWLMAGDARAQTGPEIPETDPRPSETETVNPSSAATQEETDEPAF